MGAEVSVVLLGGGEPAPGLMDALGRPRARALSRELMARARAWAAGAFGADAVRVLDHGPDAAGWLAAFTDAGRAGGSHRDGDVGDTLVIAPELAVWPPELAAAALEDLHAGCAVCLGPVFDGGAYLVGVSGAMADARPAVAGIDLEGRQAMMELFARAGQAGWEVGLLRSERGLRRAADVRALLADPMCDRELRALLG